MTVDLLLLILANVVDIQKEHLLLHTPVLNKTTRVSSMRMFVRIYRLLLIHCIYVSVTKPTCPAFNAWLNTGSIRSLKVTGKAIMLCSMALPSKLCSALHRQFNVGPMCDCKPCRSLDLSFFVEILSVVDSDHGTGPRRYKVNIMSNIKKVMLTEMLLSALIWLITFCKLGQLLLDLASLKILLACSILRGCERQVFN